ncbi:stAR-related lipid transfer protein 8 isoform X2 [Pyxicephalus adspersus]|uniref:stAR-related lipid transfer protein 8 isoform X2 n=1 Tax=Pyxicephalus adspersus TaxID=30357 RepID=UPI003B5BC653
MNRIRTKRGKNEVEAKKACDWLRAAGFPQYAQIYEDNQFPLDISCVKRDHAFLDQDSLKSLCRRLMTLNACAPMKLDVHYHRKQNEESDEDDQCAISDRWAFQRDQGRWSRLESVELLSPNFNGSPTIKSTSSRDSILTDLSTELEATSLRSVGSSRGTIDVVTPSSEFGSLDSSPAATKPCRSLSDQSLVSPRHGLKEKSKKRKSKGFLKRMESLRRREKDKNKDQTVLVSSDLLHSGTVEINCPGQYDDDGDIPAYDKEFLHSGYRTKLSTDGSNRKPLMDGYRRGVYLEDFDIPGKNSVGHKLCQKSDHLVSIPVDHKPGTFPRSLSIESLCPTSQVTLESWKTGCKSLGHSVSSSMDSHGLEVRPRRGSFSSIGSRSSIYDNVPASLAANGDLFELGGSNDLFDHLDDVLNHVKGVQRMVELWSRTVCPDLDEEEDSGGEQAGHLGYEERSISDVGTSASDFDSTGNSLNDTEETEMRERRDSGVGASLTRPCRKLRWHSFQNSHRPSLSSASLEINRQSAAQLNLLQKLSLLRLTAIMEKYSVPSKQGWAWTVPKFMKRSKVPDYRGRAVFGVPPIVNVQRTGQPLPQSIQQAMRYIRSQCLDQVGIFRKSGVKSRIQVLRQMNESSPDNVSYVGQSAYDVADLLKQYFRDLPEPIFTSKLTDTFLHIYQYVPKEQRLRAVQSAILLMPDENREVLQTLLYFLSDISSAQENQMTPGNLAVCLAPSVFHLNISKKETASPRIMQRRGNSGKPDHKDLSENLAATQGLLHMITECKKLFQVPHDMMLQSRNSYIAADTQPLSLEDFCVESAGESRDFSSILDSSIQNLLQESAERFKGWTAMPGPEHTELSCRKVGDGNPLRLWKVSTEVEAPPSSLLHRVLRERHLWDDDLLQSRVVENFEQNTDLFHYVTDSMAPHPRRQFLVLRKWRTDLPRGGCALVSTSMDHATGQPEDGVQAVIVSLQYLMEPCGMGRTRLTYICRADLRGRSPDWYNKVFGHLCAMEVVRIRNSFPPLSPCGPETKL